MTRTRTIFGTCSTKIAIDRSSYWRNLSEFVYIFGLKRNSCILWRILFEGNLQNPLSSDRSTRKKKKESNLLLIHASIVIKKDAREFVPDRSGTGAWPIHLHAFCPGTSLSMTITVVSSLRIKKVGVSRATISPRLFHFTRQLNLQPSSFGLPVL